MGQGWGEIVGERRGNRLERAAGTLRNYLLFVLIWVVVGRIVSPLRGLTNIVGEQAQDISRLKDLQRGLGVLPRSRRAGSTRGLRPCRPRSSAATWAVLIPWSDGAWRD